MSTLTPLVRQDVPPLPEQRARGELWSPGAQNRSAATSSTAHCRHNPAFPGSAAPHRSGRGQVQRCRPPGQGDSDQNGRVAAADIWRRLEGCSPHGSGRPPRSEEHTSELQSLMRISYAVFCLKKKKKKKSNKQTTTIICNIKIIIQTTNNME